MSAALTVFHIPELLEHILSELPPLDIIRYQSVNYTWQRLIADSPLLQYKAWLRRDCLDPAHEVQEEQFEIAPFSEDYNMDEELDHTMRAISHSMSKHLNPVVVACFMKAIPVSPEYDWDGGFLPLRPGLLQALTRWHEAHEASEDRWGHMPLCRPSVSAIRSETMTSTRGGIPFNLEAQHSSDPKEANLVAWGVSHKRPDEPLDLTLRDIMQAVEDQWEEWLQFEKDLHWNRHRVGCDYDVGLPSDKCLDHDKISDEEERRYAETMETSGTKRTMEGHIDALVDKATSH
jgi:hypothetical protein